MDEVTYPPMENLMGLDLRLLAGRPPRYDPDFVLENAVAFKASEGLPAALRGIKPMRPLKEAVVVLALLLVFLAPVAVLALPLVAYFSPTAALALGAPMAASVLAPARYWPACQTAWFASWVLEYFSTVLVWDARFDPERYFERSALLYTVPHGVMPVGSMLAHLVVERVFGFEAHGYAASVVFRLPLARQLIAWMGGIPADRAAIRAVLRRPREGSGGFLDGIAGMFEGGPGREVFFLGRRTGAFRLALEHGVALLGGYCFGTTDVMSCWHDRRSGVMRALSRRLRASILVPIGRWGLPIPRRVPLLLVYADVLAPARDEAPTDEAVLALRAEFLGRVRCAFETGKHLYGWGDRELVIK